ncbi:hypothetical protein CVT25_014458 [Psilocybe cyanescens]|uniref:Ribokinase n=1 Tax=Psilocybe cyanescens TaxID=93625 RepID=A0A409XR90_PSICY|nr:hypothetical protein CVT25_014458 [Psilocybe cyanescens]
MTDHDGTEKAKAGRIEASCTVRGSINHDEYFHVSHIVRPGETLSSSGHESRVGGKGANQAVAIALAGGTARFYGTIGKDGLWIRERMMRFGIDVEGIVVSEELTGRAIIQVDEQGENSIILFPGANYSDLHEQSFARHPDGPGWFPTSTHLLLQNEIPLPATYYALHSAKAQGAVVVVNPSPLPEEEEMRRFPWEKVDWLVVNEAEARGVYGAVARRGMDEVSSQRQSQKKASSPASMSTRELISSLSAEPAFVSTNIVCTLGADGVLAFVPALHRRDNSLEAQEFIQLPAAKLLEGVKDTTGAGDCFAGYFVCGLMEFAESAAGRRGEDGGTEGGGKREMREKDLERILKVAVQAAGMCCERRGTIDSYPSRSEVEARMAASV